MHRNLPSISILVASVLLAAAGSVSAARLPSEGDRSPAPPTSLVHDGYRLSEVAPLPQRWVRGGAGDFAGSCGPLPPPPALQAGELAVVPLVKDRFFNKFFQGNGRLYRMVAQHHGIPRAIVIRSGQWTLPVLAQRLAGEPGVLGRQGNTYLLQVPLLLQAGTALTLSPDETLRLSRDDGSFLISMGRLHLRGARVEAWDEVRNAAAEVAGDTSFQPFILAWSGSRTVIDHSTLTGLGFAENLAHGLTVAVGPEGLDNYRLPPPGSLRVQGSRFDGMFSAIQATAVPGLQLCDTEFVNSRQYALHIEKGSSGLLKGNHITGSQGPYAVYLSAAAGVHLLANDISENMRNGLAISNSHDITLSENILRQNFDAIFSQGTQQLALANNRILDNQRHGLSLRNVENISLLDDHIGPNRGVGLLVLAGDRLKREPAGASASPGAVVGSDTGPGTTLPIPVAVRQLRYPRLTLKGVVLEGNHSSALVLERPYSLLLDDVDVLYPGVRRRPVFRGVLNTFESDILKRLQRHRPLLVAPYSPPARRAVFRGKTAKAL